ncbi:MAG: AMP-binding protein [Microthrixaceae bacterium]
MGTAGAPRDATPDALMAVDEDMRTITFGEYWSEAERAAAGLLGSGVSAGSVVSWQLPTWIESLVLVGVLSRIGAVQNPMLPIYREREVGFVTNQAGSSLLIVPSVWRDFDFEEMGRSISAANGGTMRVLVSDRALPQGDPRPCPRYRRPSMPLSSPCAGCSTPPGRPRTPRGHSTPMPPSRRSPGAWPSGWA